MMSNYGLKKNQSRSYLNHLVHALLKDLSALKGKAGTELHGEF